ncbi:MAG TPA: PQQ-dependent sugar dehydrogenase [Rhizomicrobium sp.]|nr:PQQ-dependent sugar dehydrogenase [Rhizomicrobium sp.]
MSKSLITAALGIAALVGTAVAQQTPVTAQSAASQSPAPPSALAAGAAAPAGRGGRGNPSTQLFTNSCSGCHGTDLAGARAGSLFTESFLSSRSDADIVRTILSGIPESGMPAFAGEIAENQANQLVVYLRLRAGQLKGRPAFVPDPNGQIVRSRKQTFRIEVVAAGLATPWGGAFLPDGRLLVSERNGNLRIVDTNGKLQAAPVEGTPVPFVRQDGGMLDVAVDPDYGRNRWIYLAYSDVVPGVTPAPNSNVAPNPAPPTMTVLIRGRVVGNRWTDTQELFRAPASVYSTPSDHYGTRFLFDGKGHLFYSLGDRHNMAAAQNLSTPLGKIHRIHLDGSVPKDNPFVNVPGAVPTIWSLGHRNPQGLSFDPNTGLLWETEHGPSGGDEINIIDKGHNYGWGVVSMGLEPGITQQRAPGMDDPIAHYTPTIAPSGISFYNGNRYPNWKGNLFVAALAGQQLLRLEVDGRKIVSQEPVLKEYGRVRQVITGPDGLLYVLLQNPTGAGTGLSLSAPTAGMVIKLIPAGLSP